MRLSRIWKIIKEDVYLCCLPMLVAVTDNTSREALIIPHIMRELNSIIVSLFIGKCFFHVRWTFPLITTNICIFRFWQKSHELADFVYTFYMRSRGKHRQSRVYKTYRFPEVSVNKYFTINWVSKKKQNTTNYSNMYIKSTFLTFRDSRTSKTRR